MSKIEVFISSDLQELIPEYLETMQKVLVILNKSLEAMDLETIQREGHKLKGHGKAYGFDEISIIGAKLEESAKNSRKEEIPKLVKTLEDYIANIDIKYVD